MKTQLLSMFLLRTSIVVLVVLVSGGPHSTSAHSQIVSLAPMPGLPVIQVERVSVASDGTQGNDFSGLYWGYISGNGQHVAFGSYASNLVAGDTNSAGDMFVHNRQTGQTERISVASNGTQGNGFSTNAIAITADGRFAAFSSGASNLVPNDTNDQQDVFVHDGQSGQTEIVSIATDGSQANGTSGYSVVAISDDYRYVLFQSDATNLVANDTNGLYDVFVRDRQTGQTLRASIASDGAEGNGHSSLGMVSPDGRYIVFDSAASNLVAGDTNGQYDVFVRDTQTGETARVSVASGGAQANGQSYASWISADGRYVSFGSSATNLVSGDTNGKWDIFVHDRQTGQTTRVSVASDGSQADNDSRDGCGSDASISRDGRYVVFTSAASNLVVGDTNGVTDIFVHDRQTAQTIRVSVASDGSQADGESGQCRDPTISIDGTRVAFVSDASNLVPGDTNGKRDVFVARIVAWSTLSISGRVTDAQGHAMGAVTISDNAGHTAVTSSLGDYILDSLVPGIYVITPSRSLYTFTPPSRQVELSSTPVSGQDFVGESQDTGFRPNPDGYSFNNPGSQTQTPSCSDFQRSFSAEDIQCLNGSPQAAFVKAFRDFQSTFSQGICTGMASTAGAYYTGIEPPPYPIATYAMSFSQAWPNIAAFHGRQYSQAVLDHLIPEWNSWTAEPATISGNVDRIYDELATTLRAGNTDLVVLDILPRPGCGSVGHTVIPYRIDTTNPLQPRVYIYENFNAGSETRFVQFDFTQPTHSFSYMGDSDDCNTLSAIPLSAFVSPEGRRISSLLTASASEQAQPLMTNGGGNGIGYLDGIITSTVPGAMPVYPWYEPSITSTVTAFVLPAATYTTTLSRITGAYTYTVWSRLGSVEFWGGPSTGRSSHSSTDSDQVVFNGDLSSVALSMTASAGQPLQLEAMIHQTTASRVYRLANFGTSAGGVLTTEFFDSGLRLQSTVVTTTYDLHASIVSTETLANFAHTYLSLALSDTHIITFANSDMLTATLQIDHGSNGTIDETRILNNQLLRVYVPLTLYAH